MKPNMYFYCCSHKIVDGKPNCNIVRVLKTGYRHTASLGKGWQPHPMPKMPKLKNKAFRLKVKTVVQTTDEISPFLPDGQTPAANPS